METDAFGFRLPANAPQVQKRYPISFWFFIFFGLFYIPNSTEAAAVPVKINFQPDSSTAPSGYIKDIGLPFNDARGFGWVREDSLGGTRVPLDISPNTRDRMVAGVEPRLNTLIHLQYPIGGSNPTAVKIPAAWEYSLANGTYSVTVSVGDPSTVDSSHRLTVEGVLFINNFVPSASTKFASSTKSVTVSDGKLTVDAIGGSNTKLNFIDISPIGTPGPGFSLKMNFQSETAPVPAGYLRDFGEPFVPKAGPDQGSGLSYGWVEPGTSTLMYLIGAGRDRNRPGIDQRLDTLMHMQGGMGAGAWEVAVPNGVYSLLVSVGDQSTDSDHVINVEGSTVINHFKNSSAKEYLQATGLVRVLDGKLTIDAIRGTNTKINYTDIQADPSSANRPSIRGVTPTQGATGVLRDSAVVATVFLPTVGAGVDASTLTPANVKLIKNSDGSQVPANRNTSGGGDVIVLQPTVLLDATTEYRIEIQGVKDTSGATFLPFSSSFVTGTTPIGGGGGTVSFQKVALSTATGKQFTSLAFGPDGKLYAAVIDGQIYRFSLNADGTTGTPEIISSLQTANGGQRLLIGLAFDPSSTASNLMLWVSHTTFGFNGMPDWGGKITRLSGPSLGTVQDYVINLPRSTRDHVTNSLSFGPDGALYFLQGSNTAMGAPDNAWGLREERALTASLLRLVPSAITTPPVNVKTEEGGTYNPFSPSAPVKIYASGLRNSFDLLWHSNGQLYVPTNGSAAGGNTPVLREHYQELVKEELMM